MVTLFQLFELMFFKSFANYIVPPIIHKKIVPREVVAYVKFFQWIGLGLLIIPHDANIGPINQCQDSREHNVVQAI